MFDEDEQIDKSIESEFEVVFKKELKKQKKPNKKKAYRIPDEQMISKVELYRECRSMYEHLKDSYVRKSDLIIALPEQLQAKYILKSVAYLADEWITLKTNYIRQGNTPNKLVIDLEQLTEEQIANMCAELHECIDHFVARATEN